MTVVAASSNRSAADADPSDGDGDEWAEGLKA